MELKLSTTVIVTWHEPASYSYGKKHVQLMMAPFVIAVTIFLGRQPLAWWITPLFFTVGVVACGMPWIYERWPRFLPLQGFAATLYPDRIARSNGTSELYIAFDNILECRVSTKTDPQGAYPVLTFIPKDNGLYRKFLGILTDIALPNSTLLEQVLAVIQGQGIVITKN